MDRTLYRPGRYYIITFVATYVLWFIGAFLSHTEQWSGLFMIFMVPGLLAPFLLSLVMTFRAPDKTLRRDFFNRLVNPRLINPRVLPVYILIMPTSVVLALFLSLLFGGSIEQLRFVEEFSFSPEGMSVMSILLLAAAFEELGWRGYAFDSLLSRFNYFKSSLIFGILWSLWHLPLAFARGSYQWEIMQESVVYGLNFFIGIIPMGFIISWICIRNRKSILAAVVFHFLVNISQEMLNITQTTKCIQTVVLTVFAALIVLYDRKLFFGDGDLTMPQGAVSATA